VKGPNPLHRYTTTPTNRRCTCKCTASICTTRAKNGFPKAATNAAVASAQEVRLAHRVGAPSRRCHRVGTPAPGRCRQLELQKCARARGWCPEASSRVEANQPRRRAGRRVGAHRRGKGPRQESCPDPVAANANAECLRLRLGE
jgi:hypothetical protein